MKVALQRFGQHQRIASDTTRHGLRQHAQRIRRQAPARLGDIGRGDRALAGEAAGGARHALDAAAEQHGTGGQEFCQVGVPQRLPP